MAYPPPPPITELCLQLTGDEHRALWSQSSDRALLTMVDLPLPLDHDCLRTEEIVTTIDKLSLLLLYGKR